MDEIKEIAMRIKELREICDYTEEEVAARLGVSVEEYKQYEKDGQGIPINVIYQLSKMYKVDFSEILTGCPRSADASVRWHRASSVH